MPLSARKKEYLRLMGIPIYSERTHEAEELLSEEAVVPLVSEANAQDTSAQETTSLVKSLTSVNESSTDITKSLVNKQRVQVSEISVHDVLQRSDLPEDWSDLIDHVANCTRCDLHSTRTQTVFGVGDINADWMIIGEAPGADEDKQGEPFLGKHGDLMNTILESIGLSRSQVYIVNSLKCSPPGNRDSKKSELAQCRAYLEQQIALVDPKVIICVGRVASQNLLQLDEPISRLRGKVHSLQNPIKVEKNIPVIVTYHPAYLLRSPSQKAKVWDDLKLAFSVLNH